MLLTFAISFSICLDTIRPWEVDPDYEADKAADDEWRGLFGDKPEHHDLTITPEEEAAWKDIDAQIRSEQQSDAARIAQRIPGRSSSELFTPEQLAEIESGKAKILFQGKVPFNKIGETLQQVADQAKKAEQK